MSGLAMSGADPKAMFASYADRLASALRQLDLDAVERLAHALKSCWQSGHQVFLVGNGGSAGNAMHLANDYLYALSKRPGSGIRAHALAANPSVVTCLANDEGYENVFVNQLDSLLNPGDIVIGISTSGNSPNVLKAMELARQRGATTIAFTGTSPPAA